MNGPVVTVAELWLLVWAGMAACVVATVYSIAAFVTEERRRRKDAR